MPRDWGRGAHQAAHSLRMGVILVWAVNKQLDQEAIGYLKILTQSPGCDYGEPASASEYRVKRKQRKAERSPCGRILTEAIVESDSDSDRGNIRGFDKPDPYFRVVSESNL